MREDIVEAFPLESRLGSGHDRYKDREEREKLGGILVRQGGEERYAIAHGPGAFNCRIPYGIREASMATKRYVFLKVVS